MALATLSTPGCIKEPLASAMPRCRKYEGWRRGSRIGGRNRRGIHLRLLIFQLFDLVVQFLMLLAFVFGHQGDDHRLVDLMRERVIGQRLLNLLDIQLLPVRTLIGRGAPRVLHVFRKLRDRLLDQPLLIWRFEIGLRFAERPLEFRNPVDFRAVLRDLYWTNQAGKCTAESNRTPPGSGSNPSAESDRTYDCGSVRNLQSSLETSSN